METVRQNFFLFNMIQFIASCLVGFSAIVAAIVLGLSTLPILVGCVIAGFILGFPIAWFVTQRVVQSSGHK